MTHDSYHCSESYTNGLLLNRPIKTNPVEQLSTNHQTSDILSSRLQSRFVQRHQSLDYDKNINIQRLPNTNMYNRDLIKTNNINNKNQSK